MKTNLLFILLFCSVATHAQFSTGQKLINARLDLGASNTVYATNKYGSGFVSGSLSLMRFTTPALLQGFGITYGYSESHSNINNISYQNSPGAFYAVTRLQPLGKKFYLTYGGNISGTYSFGKQIASPGNYMKSNAILAGASGTLGLLYQLNQRLILMAELSNLFSLQYSHGNDDDYFTSPAGVVTKTNTSTTNTVQLNSGLRDFNLNNFTFGISYLLK